MCSVGCTDFVHIKFCRTTLLGTSLDSSLENFVQKQSVSYKSLFDQLSNKTYQSLLFLEVLNGIIVFNNYLFKNILHYVRI